MGERLVCCRPVLETSAVDLVLFVKVSCIIQN